ncbi:MAG: hypothetical protein OEZ52_02670 [Candidatus Aminicenantes bacterium]|nr:hypothetical protein [Candidatus Aminicenantes bacterium]MDH5742427.1 hypothetical protein [Candidatus Aminicenantes bacterium]
MRKFRVRLIHWNAAEASERANRLIAAGYDVISEQLSPASLREMRENPPDAVVIDLSRLPSHGRDIALGIRKFKSTRYVPLVLVGGDPEKVIRVKKILPDAVYTTWSRIQGALKRAIVHPPKDPVVPRTTLDGYSGTPLPKKLGIKADSVVCLIDAPQSFEERLAGLPEGFALRKKSPERCDLIIWFVKSRKILENRIDGIKEQLGKGGIWIAWPKKASKIPSDLSQTVVRSVGLASGLVDFKVCSIDETWSGLRFSRRPIKYNSKSRKLKFEHST